VEEQQSLFVHSDGWEDERRLAYVALTRAKNRVTICWSNEVSPFVLEALDGADPGLAEQATRARNAERRERREKGKQGSEAEERRKSGSREFTAKLVSRCQLCSSHVVPGEKIVGVDGGFAHVRCVRDEARLPNERGVGPRRSGSSRGSSGGSSRQQSSPAGGGNRATAGRSPGFEAKFPSRCDRCGLPITPGQRILKSEPGFAHVGCKS